MIRALALDLAVGAMVSKYEPGNLLSVAKWESSGVRTKLDYSGGSPPPSLETCASLRVHIPIDIAERPLDGAEAPSSSVKQSSRQRVGGKILKLLKFRKKTNSAGAKLSDEALQPSLTTFRFQDQSGSKRFGSVEDVDLERYHYDSDEPRENVNERHRRNSSGNSCSTSISTSSRSSASAQSFSSMTSRSSVTTPRASFILSGHQSGAQLMANILISISNLDEDDELGSEFDHPVHNGPHESAWHQTRDEILGGPRISSAKQSSGRNTPRLGRCSLDVHLTSPGPSRRFGKLDLSKIDRLR